MTSRPGRRGRRGLAGHAAPHDARAGAHRGAADEHRRAGHAQCPADDHHATDFPLVRVRRARRDPGARRPRRRSTPAGGVPTSMPMSATVTTPACERPGSNSRPGFRAANVTVRSALTAGPSIAPVKPVDARRDVDGNDRRPAVRPRCRPPTPRHPRASPVKPVPNIASTKTSARAERALEACRARSRLPAQTCRPALPSPRSTRAATRPSPPLLPLPHTTTARRP